MYLDDVEAELEAVEQEAVEEMKRQQETFAMTVNNAPPEEEDEVDE